MRQPRPRPWGSYQQNAGNRCANGRIRRSRSTIVAEVMCSHRVQLFTGAIKWGDTNFAFVQLRRLRGSPSLAVPVVIVFGSLQEEVPCQHRPPISSSSRSSKTSEGRASSRKAISMRSAGPTSGGHINLQLELPTIPVARAVSVREAWSHRRLEVLPGRRRVAQLVGASLWRVRSSGSC
jgi:hypothetical protein